MVSKGCPAYSIDYNILQREVAKMKMKILFSFLLFFVLPLYGVPCFARGVDNAKAGLEALERGNSILAIELFTRAIKSEQLSLRDLEASYYNRGYAWDEKGEYDKAIADYTMAIELNPKFTEAYYNRGNAWEFKGQLDKAIADYTYAINLNPKHFNAYYKRGIIEKRKKQYDKAIADYTSAIKLNPRFAYAYNNRGNAWDDKGRYAKAIADYNKAIELNPKDATAYSNLAWVLATCPDERHRDGKQAIKFAEKALGIKEAAHILDTLAAAYAEAKKFQDAITTQEKAIARLQKAGKKKEFIAEFQRRLESYRGNKPWREN
jgi:tetratricopeptide (TPR) repeat protein